MKGTGQWYCSVCPKSFGRKGDLTRHKLLHAGVKRHVCPTCNKAFSQYSGLKTHQNIHTKIKPFVCGLNSCSASFGDPSSCARHRKETHRRTSAYRCPYPLCKSSIKRRSAFAAHLKKHNIDIKYVDIDAMVPPLLPVVSKRESIQEVKVTDVMPQRGFESQQAVAQARQMYFDANASESSSPLHEYPHHQTSIPWKQFEIGKAVESTQEFVINIMPESSYCFYLNNYDNIDISHPVYTYPYDLNSSGLPWVPT